MPEASERAFRISGLGEIAIRCRDFPAMVAFYETTLGLEPLRGAHRPGLQFFRIAEGVAGHTTVLALFSADLPPQTGRGSSLHHIALSLPVDQLDAVRQWYRQRNQRFTEERFDWVGWRGLFTRDPDGNTVEIVAFDPALAGQGAAPPMA